MSDEVVRKDVVESRDVSGSKIWAPGGWLVVGMS